MESCVKGIPPRSWGHSNTTGGPEFNTPIKQPPLFSQEKRGGWKDGRLQCFIVLHAELPLPPRSIFSGRAEPVGFETIDSVLM